MISEPSYRFGRGADRFATWNPARPACLPACLIGDYGADDSDPVRKAVARAAHAFRAWRALPAGQRAEHVATWLDRLAQRADDIAREIVLEQGKLLGEARGELAEALAEARFMVSQGLYQGSCEVGAARRGTLRRARGVVGALTPWDFPILTPPAADPLVRKAVRMAISINRRCFGRRRIWLARGKKSLGQS